MGKLRISQSPRQHRLARWSPRTPHDRTNWSRIASVSTVLAALAAAGATFAALMSVEQSARQNTISIATQRIDILELEIAELNNRVVGMSVLAEAMKRVETEPDLYVRLGEVLGLKLDRQELMNAEDAAIANHQAEIISRYDERAVEAKWGDVSAYRVALSRLMAGLMEQRQRQKNLDYNFLSLPDFRVRGGARYSDVPTGIAAAGFIAARTIVASDFATADVADKETARTKKGEYEELKKFMTDEYDRFRKTQIARMARAGKAQQNKPPN